MKTLHLNSLLFISKKKMIQASKANENVPEYSKTGLCITVKVLRMLPRGNTQKSFKCDRGSNFSGCKFEQQISHGDGVFLCLNHVDTH